MYVGLCGFCRRYFSDTATVIIMRFDNASKPGRKGHLRLTEERNRVWGCYALTAGDCKYIEHVFNLNKKTISGSTHSRENVFHPTRIKGPLQISLFFE